MPEQPSLFSDPISYFFYSQPSAGGGLSYAELKRRRDIAAVLAGRNRGFPKTLGEGMTYFGEALADAVEDRRLRQMEGEQRATEEGKFGPPAATEPSVSPFPRQPVEAPPVQPQPVAQPAPAPQQPIQPGVPGQMTPALQQQLQQKPTAGAAPPLQAPQIDAGTLDPTPISQQPVPNLPGANPPVPATPTQVTPPGPTLGAVPAPGSREAIAATMMQQRGLPASPAQAQGPAGVPGGGGPQGPQYASYGRPGVASDASPGGVGPFPAAAGGIGAAAAALGPPAPPQSGPPVAQNRVRTVPVGPGEMPPMGLPTPGMGAPPPVPPRAAPAPAPPVSAPLPSEEPIPPLPNEQYPDPGPRPQPPQPVYSTPAMDRWRALMNDRTISPEGRARAEGLFKEEQTKLHLQQQREHAEYINSREAWERRSLEKEKFERERPVRNLETQYRRLQIQEAIASRANDPVQASILRGNLEKLGIEIQQARRKLAEPDTVAAGGTQFQRPAGAPANMPYTVPPGLPQPKDEPLTEAQAANVQFVQRVTPDIATLDDPENSKVLTLPSERIRDVPGVGNILISDRYRMARNAAQNWAGAFMTKVSGAAVSPSEAERNLPAFIPQVGDDEAELAAKARRRRDYTQAVAQTSGREGMKLLQDNIRQINESPAYVSKLPPVPVKSPEEAARLPKGRKIILPDGREGTVK